MKNRLTEKQKKALAVLGTTASVYLALKYVLRLFFPFLLSWWLAVLVGPAAVFLEQKTCVKRTVWASLFITVLSAVLLFLGYILGRLFLEQLIKAAAHLPSWFEELCGWLDGVCRDCDRFLGFSGGTTMEFVESRGQRFLETAEHQAGTYLMMFSPGIFTGTAKLGGLLAVAGIGGVLVVGARGRILHWKNTSVFRQELSAAAGCISRVGRNFLLVQLFIMLLTSILCGVGLYALGNPYAVLLGAGLGLLDALPVFGTGTVLIPWAVIMLFTGNWTYAIGLMLLYLLSYFLREILEAKLMGSRMGIRPLEMLMSMYAGLLLFGVTGFLLGPLGYLLVRELSGLYTGEGRIIV